MPTPPHGAATRLALAAAAVLAAAAAPSAPADDRRGPTEFGEAVEGVGRARREPSAADAASAGSAGADRVADRPLLRPGEILELVPGLVATQHSGAGKADQYLLRGFDLDHGTDFLTSLDGVPLNLRSHAHGQGYTDLNVLIPELVSRVDSWKGPYRADRGDFASAGGAEIRYAESLPRSLLAVAGGSFGSYRAVVAGSPQLAGGHLLYGLELAHEDGPWVNPDDYRRLNAVLRYTQREGESAWGVTGMVYAGGWNATDQVPLRAVRDGRLDRFGAIDPTGGGDSHRYALSANLTAPLSFGRVRAAAYAVRHDLALFSNLTYFLDRPEAGDQLEQRDDRWLFGGSAAWSAPVSLAGLDADLTVGVEARHDRLDPVGLYDTVARRRALTRREDRVRETSGGAFAEVAAAFTPWLRASAGARADAYRFDVRAASPAAGAPSASGDAVSAARLSPKATAVLGPWRWTELFLHYGSGFHSNDARGVTARVDPATPLVGTRGAEVGLRTEPWPGVQTSLALWLLDLDSELVFAGDAGTTESSPPTRRQGLEWSGRLDATGLVRLDADVSLSRARFRDRAPAGDRVPGAVETVASVGATLRAVGPFTLGAHLRHFGPRPLTEDDRVRSAATTLLDLQATWRVAAPVALRVDVFNALDARDDAAAYFYASRLRGEPAAVEDVHFHPTEPRGVRGTLTFSY